MPWLLPPQEAQFFRNVRRALSQLYQSARTGRLEPPAVILLGDDEFLLQRVAQRLVDLLLPPEERKMAMTVLNGKETGADALADALLTAPFGFEVVKRRVVLLKTPPIGAERATRRKGGEGSWWHWLHQLTPNTFVIVTLSPMPSLNLLNTLNPVALLVPIPKLRPQDLAEFVQMLAEQIGVQITKDGAGELIERVGNDPRQLANEIEKLALIVGAGGRITVDLVRQSVPSLAMDVFDLVNAVTEGNASKALKVLERLLHQREQPMRILGLLARQFRLLLQARLLLDSKQVSPALLHARPEALWQQLERIPDTLRQRLPDSQQYNLLRQPPQGIRVFLQRAREFSRSQLHQALRLILETDVEMKSGVDQGQRLVLLVLQLCQLRAKGDLIGQQSR